MTASEHTHLQSQIVELIPALRAFARRFYSAKADADDLVQETLMKALANLDRFKVGSSVKTWMFTIMRNAFCTRYRLAKREAPGTKDCVALSRSIDASQETAVVMDELARALDRLPRHQRDAVIGVALHGESYEALAAKEGCAVGTIKSRLNRARLQLTEELGLGEEAIRAASASMI